MRNGNPALSEDTFEKFAENGTFTPTPGTPDHAVEVMTVEGTANKTMILLLLAVISASITWSMVLKPGGSSTAFMLMIGGMISAFIVGMITIYNPKSSPYLAPVYALLEGLVLGGVSAVVNARYPGIATQAVGLTFGTLAVMLLAYRARLIQVTDKLRMGIVAATGGVCIFYFFSWIMRMFGVGSSFLAYDATSPLAIGISLVVVVIAALNLVLDFDLIERGTKYRAPKFMEWYGAFSLMVTLVWLYLELLRLLARLSRR
jgi:uncharacterized YccA/Bax inhibitor family protein